MRAAAVAPAHIASGHYGHGDGAEGFSQNRDVGACGRQGGRDFITSKWWNSSMWIISHLASEMNRSAVQFFPKLGLSGFISRIHAVHKVPYLLQNHSVIHSQAAFSPLCNEVVFWCGSVCVWWCWGRIHGSIKSMHTLSVGISSPALLLRCITLPVVFHGRSGFYVQLACQFFIISVK